MPAPHGWQGPHRSQRQPSAIPPPARQPQAQAAAAKPEPKITDLLDLMNVPSEAAKPVKSAANTVAEPCSSTTALFSQRQALTPVNGRASLLGAESPPSKGTALPDLGTPEDSLPSSQPCLTQLVTAIERALSPAGTADLGAQPRASSSSGPGYPERELQPPAQGAASPPGQLSATVPLAAASTASARGHRAAHSEAPEEPRAQREALVTPPAKDVPPVKVGASCSERNSSVGGEPSPRASHADKMPSSCRVAKACASSVRRACALPPPPARPPATAAKQPENGDKPLTAGSRASGSSAGAAGRCGDTPAAAAGPGGDRRPAPRQGAGSSDRCRGNRGHRDSSRERDRSGKRRRDSRDRDDDKHSKRRHQSRDRGSRERSVHERCGGDREDRSSWRERSGDRGGSTPRGPTPRADVRSSQRPSETHRSDGPDARSSQRPADAPRSDRHFDPLRKQPSGRATSQRDSHRRHEPGGSSGRGHWCSRPNAQGLRPEVHGGGRWRGGESPPERVLPAIDELFGV